MDIRRGGVWLGLGSSITKKCAVSETQVTAIVKAALAAEHRLMPPGSQQPPADSQALAVIPSHPVQLSSIEGGLDPDVDEEDTEEETKMEPDIDRSKLPRCRLFIVINRWVQRC